MRRYGASDQLARTVAVDAVLPAQQPLLDRQRAVAQGAPRQQISAPWHRRCGCPAVPVYLRTAAASPVRQRSHSAARVACAIRGGLVFFIVVEAEKFVIRSSGS